MEQRHLTMAAAALMSATAVVGYLLFVRKPKKSRASRGEEQRALVDLVRQNVRDLTPYRCARDDYSGGTLLDANENSIGPALAPSKVEMDVSKLDLNRYPDPYQLEVKTLLAEMREVRPEQIFVGVGSDEAIDLLIRVFCRPGKDSIIVTPPTYKMYQVCADVNDVQVQTVPQTPQFEVVASEVIRAATPATKLVFLCSPGNPTGKALPLSVVRDIVMGGFDGIVVVDEAYVDFSNSAESACSLIHELDRVVVLQTMSKAFGMAAIRMGMAYGNEQIIHFMNKVKAPYNVNRLTQDLAVKALSDRTLFHKQINTLLEERTRLQEALRSYSFVREVKESDANFFLAQVDGAHEIYKRMAGKGVVVRYRGNELHCKNCLRITVGTPEENNRLLELLQETVAEILAAS